MMKNVWMAAALMLTALGAKAEPFSSCPSKAFLVQDTVAQLYGVNLVTGDYSVLSSDLGTTSKINGFGFNFHDNYLYGWGYEWGTVIQIGNDLIARPLQITNNPGTNFYVGDVALLENAYYMYKPGSSYGLYRVSLDENDIDYLVATRVVGGGAGMNLRIFDLAFHPENGSAYSVDAQGNLWLIDVQQGESVPLGNVGQTGTFGAVYFDVNGSFYISRNQDGHVFRIDVSSSDPTAEFFAFGPSSANNDGARCAIAPIVDDTLPPDTDFGDAPDSYGTSLASNGARHGVTNLFLGNLVDAEYEAYVAPGSDDSVLDDEDGVSFITQLEAGLDSLAQVKVNGSGYLNLWADWNQDGDFDYDEQVLVDQWMETGTTTLLLEVPFTALTGDTWVRVRFSSTLNLGPTGGVSDGEVEDYQVSVANPGYAKLNNSPYILAFEDNWPEQGDYDFNDVVMSLESSVIVGPGNVVKQLTLAGDLKAMGASYHNGFAIQLDGVTAEQIDRAKIRFEINGEAAAADLLDADTEFAVLRISEDLWQQVKSGPSCWFYKTEKGCDASTHFSFRVKLPLIDGINRNEFPAAPYNPFIYATPDTFHGTAFATPPGRSLEIHLKNRVPTSVASFDYWGLGQDASDPDNGLLYQNENGLPWGIAISTSVSETWFHPYEWVNILRAYPGFESYAISEGSEAGDWYKTTNAIVSHTYRY